MSTDTINTQNNPHSNILYKTPWFQTIELILYGVFISLLLYKEYNQEILPDNVALLIPLIAFFGLIRIFFEFKNNITSNWGTIGRFLLLIANCLILVGFTFTLLNIPYQKEITTIMLLFLAVPYLINSLTLRNFDWPIKLSLFFSSISILLLSLGFLFSFNNLVYAEVFISAGIISCLLTTFQLIYVFIKNKTNFQGQYHLVYYIFRAFLLLLMAYIF